MRPDFLPGGPHVDRRFEWIAIAEQIEHVVSAGREGGDEAPAIGVEAADNDAAAFATAGMPDGVRLNHRPPLRVVRDRDGRLRVQFGLQRAAAVRAPRTWRGRVNPDAV